MRERPDNFVLKHDHPLAKGLVFAGLGQSPGSTRYIESSKYGNHGRLAGMVPGSSWVWVQRLGRWACINLSTLNEVYIPAPSVFTQGGNITMLCFFDYVAALSGGAAICCYDGSSGAIIQMISDSWHFCVGDSGSGYICSTTGLNHIAGTYNSSTSIKVRTYNNGRLQTTQTTARTVSTTAELRLFKGRTWRARGTIIDPMVYYRELSQMEISEFADRSNTMLSGMLQPPKRKYHVIKYHPITKKYLVIRGRTMSFSS